MEGRFLVNPRKGKLMGVCAGLADYTGVDVLVFRLGMIIGTMFSGPVVPLLYVLTGWLAEKDR